MIVAVEGIDGSGKTTLIEYLKKDALFKKWIFLKEPYLEEVKVLTKGYFVESVPKCLFYFDRLCHFVDRLKPSSFTRKKHNS